MHTCLYYDTVTVHTRFYSDIVVRIRMCSLNPGQAYVRDIHIIFTEEREQYSIVVDGVCVCVCVCVCV